MLAVQQLLVRIQQRDGLSRDFFTEILLSDRTGVVTRALLTLEGIKRIYSWKQDLILTSQASMSVCYTILIEELLIQEI